MTSFAYPKQKHARREAPPRYQVYKSFRPFLEREFQHICVYCRKPDSIDPASSFGIDHYRPKTKFRQLENEYSNLYYCCGPCNSRKGAYWPETAKAEVASFIPNPCEHVMWEHLRYSAETVTARSKPGEFALDYLDLNDAEIIKFRRFVLDMLDTAAATLAELANTEKKIRRAVANGKVTEQQGQNDLTALEQKRTQLQTHVARLCGG